MFDMKTVTISTRSKYRTLHIEAPGCIINIRVGLTNSDGKAVTNISISADGARYAGKAPWWLEVADLTSATREGAGVRVIEAA